MSDCKCKSNCKNKNKDKDYSYKIKEIDQWITFLFNNPSGYWSELVAGVGSPEFADKLKKAIIVIDNSYASEKTYIVSGWFYKKYIFRWISCKTRRFLEDIELDFEKRMKESKVAFDGYFFSDETVKNSDIRRGDVVLEGDSNFKYRVLTSVSPCYWEYFDENGYYKETKPRYCHWLVRGQKNAGGKLVRIV